MGSSLYLILLSDCKGRLKIIKTILGVSIAERKHLTSSRTQKLSSPAAKLVPGELGVKIARCTLFKIKNQLKGWFFYFKSSQL